MFRHCLVARFLAVCAVATLLLSVLWLLSLHEPVALLPMGEYIAGEYPTGLALFQPSSGHYYAISYFKDAIIESGKQVPLFTLPDRVTSGESQQLNKVFKQLRNILFPTSLTYRITTRYISTETILMTEKDTAQVKRTWQTANGGSAMYSHGVLTLNYHPQDLLIDPATNTLFIDDSRLVEGRVLEQRIKTSLRVSGPLPAEGVWPVNGTSLLISHPEGTGLIKVTAEGDQQLFINPEQQTIDLVTPLQGQRTNQKVLIETWPTVSAYPWEQRQ